MEDNHKTEDCHSTTLPLHLQNRKDNNYFSRDPPDGMSKFSDRRRRNSSISKRISSSSNKTNGRFQGEACYNSMTMDTYYVSNDTASSSSLSSLSQAEQKKYSRRRKNKKSRCNSNRLFLMMVALVALSFSFAVYSMPKVFDPTADIDDGPSDSSRRVAQHRSKGLPRIVALNADQFGSFRDNPHHMTGSFVANLVDLPENASVIRYVDLSSFGTDYSAAKVDPKATSNNSSEVAESPPSATARDEKKCLPMAKWMAASFPTCNLVHEIDMYQGVKTQTYEDEDDLKFLGQGWFRDTWKYANENFEGSPAVVIKTLRIEREFLEEYFDLHRRDAVAMERLTFSPYVVNVHGYCGQSAINELAEGIMDGKINNLEKLNRKLRGKEKDPQALLLKLQVATKVSLGLAHIHNIHISDEIGSRSKSVHSLLYEHTDPNSTHSTTGFGRSIPTMAHYDVSSSF